MPVCFYVKFKSKYFPQFSIRIIGINNLVINSFWLGLGYYSSNKKLITRKIYLKIIGNNNFFSYITCEISRRKGNGGL